MSEPVFQRHKCTQQYSNYRAYVYQMSQGGVVYKLYCGTTATVHLLAWKLTPQAARHPTHRPFPILTVPRGLE